MKDETKEFIQMHVSILKEAMKTENIIIGFAVDNNDVDNSKLCFLDKEEFEKGNKDGIMISLSELNRGLI